MCRRIYGKHYEKLVENMHQLHPDLGEWMIWEGYGKVLSRPFLSPRVRELLIVAMTAVLQVERQFHSHVKGALHVGASREETAPRLPRGRPVDGSAHRRPLPYFLAVVDRSLNEDLRI